MHEQGLKLESLWGREQERDALLREKKALADAISEATAKLAHAEHLAQAAQKVLDGLMSERAAVDEEVATYTKRRDRARKLLADGSAPDWNATQSQADQCAEIVDRGETRQLELMDLEEAANRELTGARNVVSLIRNRLQEAKARQVERTPSLDAEIAQATTARDAAREGVWRELLQRYDDLRRRNMAVFSEVVAGNCATCGVRQVAIDLANHKRALQVGHCHNCGRFLGNVT